MKPNNTDQAGRLLKDLDGLGVKIAENGSTVTLSFQLPTKANPDCDKTENTDRARVEINHQDRTITYTSDQSFVCKYEIKPQFTQRTSLSVEHYVRNILDEECLNAPEEFYSDMTYDHESKIAWSVLQAH